MKIYIYYKGKSAGVEYKNQNVMLEINPEYIYNRVCYFINMDKGIIAFTTGPSKKGGRPINPKGKIGKQLIKLANSWIKNPETIWHNRGYWHGLFYKRKYERFYYNG